MFLAGFDDHRRTVTTPSAELSYVDIGAGPAALFVHGIATSAYLWHDLIAQLTGLRRCIAVDLPLHGRSRARPGQELTIAALADVVAEFCERLELSEFELVANDTGGAIAQVLAARHPRLLRTLTLTNCETRQTIPPAAMAPRNLRVPTLIAWGTDDQLFGLKWAYWLQDTIPSAREVIEIIGGKLFFPHERAGELASYLRCHWAAPESAAEPLRSDLIDGLCDALDEYEAGAADLPALVRDVDSVIVELAPLSDPTWTGELRDQSRILSAALEETRPRHTASLSSSQIERIAAATKALRRLLSVAR